jgi:hypothetical protein
MFLRNSNETLLAYRFLLLTAVVIVYPSIVLCHAGENTIQKTSQFDRPDAEIIKVHTRRILSERNFAPNKTFMQWLMEKLSRWDKPNLHLGERWGTYILWFVTFWCIFSLIAILIHFIWTISLLIRSNIKLTGTTRSRNTERLRITSFEELYKMAQELARKNSFREAVSLMMAALLRFLDSINVIHLHDSKTNGDYIRECPLDYACREDFRKFVLMFEQNIYGGFHSSHKIYQQMDSLMEKIRSCDRQ